MNIASDVEFTKQTGQLSMNFSGPVVTITFTDEFGNVFYTIMFIDMNQNHNAIAMHANGTVRAGNSKPYKTLVAHIDGAPNWIQMNSGFDLH